MKLFIWKSLDNLTSYYHSSGGLVIVAESLSRAHEMNPISASAEPDYEYEVSEGAENEIVFPDAGCC